VTVPPSKNGVLDRFHAPVRAWFQGAFKGPSDAQAKAWTRSFEHRDSGVSDSPIGSSLLLLAPTGSGKTLAAFLAALDRIMFQAAPGKGERCRVLYVSPLKALGVDIEKNLRVPIAGIAKHALETGVSFHLPTVGVRTGDTPTNERAKMVRAPPDILITTPESLFLLLTSRARETLRSVETVIVDEIHSLVPTKRGAHLVLSLERLEALRRGSQSGARRLQRIGLSATQRPLDEVARFLGGGDLQGEVWTPREVAIVDAGRKKQIELTVEVPVDDLSQLARENEPQKRRVASNRKRSAAMELDGNAAASQKGEEARRASPEEGNRRGSHADDTRRSIWPALHPRLLELIRAHRTTMIFVNARRVGEKLATAINELAGEELALAHHGSVAREARQVMEERLKAGTLPCIVATSSLELGIDMGAVDLVIQIAAPPSVASGLQRLGRAHHQVGGVPSGVLFPKHRGDLLASAAAASGMAEGAVEATFYPRNPLDVLAQQIVAISTEGTVAVEDLFALIRSAAPFAELPRSSFEGVLDMLSGRYPSDEFAELRARIVWDRVQNTIRARDGAQRLAVTNAGTIPDRGLYGVFLEGQGGVSRRVGELDEEMVHETRAGEVFMLGASSWRVEEITHERVTVTPAPGVPGKMPFWRGDGPGRTKEFGARIGKLARELSAGSDREGKSRLRKEGLDERAANNLLAYLRDQTAATGEVPSDKQIVVERFFDELGDVRVCVMTPFGARVHAPWATAIRARLGKDQGREIDALWSDDGMIFRLPDSPEAADGGAPATELFFPQADEIEDQVTRALGETALFASRFRENAGRALLLPRRHPGQRSPLWSTRRKAAELLSVAQRYGSFPILLETYRECLRDVFDLPGLVALLNDVQQRKIRVTTVDTKKASPFASTLLFAYVANFIYDGDAPLAERRAQALSLDQTQLRELLGDAELRELLDAEAISAHEQQAQRLEPKRALRSADGLHDLLRSLGDLSRDEIAARVTEEELPAAPDFIAALLAEKRIAQLEIAGEARLVVLEDVARYRDALGVAPAKDLPAQLLQPVADPLGDLVSRYARTHGPFFAEEVARRFGLGTAPVRTALQKLGLQDRVLEGEFLPPELLAARGRAGLGAASGRGLPNSASGIRNTEFGVSHPAPGSRVSIEYCDAEVLRALKRRSLARLRREVQPVPQVALARFSLEWQSIVEPQRGPNALLAAIEQLEGAALPASSLYEILGARVHLGDDADRLASSLDQLCAAGTVVWRGLSPIGADDGRLALYLAEDSVLLAPPANEAPGDLQAKLRASLRRRGASFFHELQSELQVYPRDLLVALWDLVWAGEVTNDTLSPLRSRLRGDPERDTRRLETPLRGISARRTPLPGSEGRWSLLGKPGGSATERATALARSLLARHGVLTREAVHGEGIEGGFSSVYGVLKAMEESGRVRRGYFVEGLGATQFALPGAEERLRALREPSESGDGSADSRAATSSAVATILAATDPANPYGATLPWPEREGAHPQRAARAQVVLWDGELLAVISRGERGITTYLPKDEPMRSAALGLLARTFSEMVEGGRRRAILISRIDGTDASDSPLAPAFVAVGFTAGQKGLFKRRPLEQKIEPLAFRPTLGRLRAPRRNPMRGPLGPDISPRETAPQPEPDDEDLL
jgi:ATP-dependent Lhr-like helicase